MLQSSEINLKAVKKLDSGMNPYEGFEYEDTNNIFDKYKTTENSDVQNVIFTAIEFPWIFRGKSA